MGTNWAANSFSSGESKDAWNAEVSRFKNRGGNGGGNLGMNAGANAPQPNAPAQKPAIGGFDDTMPSRSSMSTPSAAPKSPLPYPNTSGPRMTDDTMYGANGAPVGPDFNAFPELRDEWDGPIDVYDDHQGADEGWRNNMAYGMPADGWQANLHQPQPEWNPQPLQPNQEVHDAGLFESMPESWYSNPEPQWETDPDYQITSGPNGGSSYRSKFYDPEMAAKYGNLGNQRPDRGTANGRDMGGGAVHYGNQGSYYDSMGQRERGLYFG